MLGGPDAGVRDGHSEGLHVELLQAAVRERCGFDAPVAILITQTAWIGPYAWLAARAIRAVSIRPCRVQAGFFARTDILWGLRGIAGKLIARRPAVAQGVVSPNYWLRVGVKAIAATNSGEIVMSNSMKVRLAAVALALYVASFSSVAADALPATESVMTMRVDGELAIDPQGKVLDYRIDTKLEPALRAQVDKAVPRWSFVPVLIDGKAAAVKSKMRITLAAQQVAAGYVVSIDNVVFYDDRATTTMQVMGADAKLVDDISTKTRKPVRYPMGLMRAGVEGAVLVYIRVTSDGKAGDVVAVQSALFNVRGRDKTITEALRLLENNTVAALKQWRFTVPSGRASLNPALMTVVVPVHYTMENKSSDTPGEWRIEVRSERESAPWLTDSLLAQDIGVSDLASDEVMPLGSRLHMREGLTGNKAL